MQKAFSENFRKNSRIAEVYKRIRQGVGTFEDANEFARETGKALSDAFEACVSSDVLPDGKMYYNIAQKVVQPTLAQNFALATKVAGMVQENLNEKAGIGIKTQIPALNHDKVDGFLNRISSEENFDKVKWILGAPVENFTESAVDDTIRANADFQARSGRTGKIVRKCVNKCCAWCEAIAGTYDYDWDSMPEDIFRRHDNCNCLIEYYPGDGTFQNVHSKRWYDVESKNRVEKGKGGNDNSTADNGGRILKPVSVKYQYFNDATPGRGNIDYQNGYSLEEHTDEVSMARFLQKTFGGDVKCLTENNVTKMPDFLWNGALWDLKTPKSTNVNKVVKKGMSQIKENPGGIIIDFRNKNVDIDDIRKQLNLRMGWYYDRSVDIMIVQKSRVVDILRYNI